METTGLVLELYRAHYGTTPLLLADDFGPCDVAAALTADGKTLTLSVVNPTAAEVPVELALAGRTLAGAATRWHIGGGDPRAHNAPGQPRTIDIQRTDGVAPDALRVPALSCALFELPLR
jgi:alpha-N-arabinofuranosidase